MKTKNYTKLGELENRFVEEAWEHDHKPHFVAIVHAPNYSSEVSDPEPYSVVVVTNQVRRPVDTDAIPNEMEYETVVAGSNPKYGGLSSKEAARDEALKWMREHEDGLVDKDTHKVISKASDGVELLAYYDSASEAKDAAADFQANNAFGPKDAHFKVVPAHEPPHLKMAWR